MRILTIGAAMYDLFLGYETPHSVQLEQDGCVGTYILLEEGHKIELSSLTPSTGGGATNSACSFTRLGFDTAVCAKVGGDESAQFIAGMLSAHHIDISYLSVEETERTGCSFILPAPDGNKAILVYRGANVLLGKKNIPVQDFAQFDALYITSLSNGTAALLPFIAKQAQAHGIPVIANPGTSQLTKHADTLLAALPFIEVVILNCFEATLFMEQLGYTKKLKKQHSKVKLPDLLSAPISSGKVHFTVHDYFGEIHARGPRIAVVTNGADGVYASDGATIYYHPSLPIDVINTVGAGDAFGSTFVAQLFKDKSIEDAIRAGIINSASVLGHSDATSGLLDQDSLDELIGDIDQNGIKKYPLIP
jgi:sugar/nucleoside kinase (ribokinase family)